MDRRWTNRSFRAALACLSLAWAGSARAAAAPDPIAALAARFQAAKPTVRVSYRVVYRFLGIEWKQLATASIDCTGGTWSNAATGAATPALFFDMRMDTGEPEAAARRSHVSLHFHMALAEAVPEFRGLVYAKASHEYLNPVIGRAFEAQDISVYNLESGRMNFWKTNLLTGEVTTKLTNDIGIARMSALARPMLEAVMDAYAGRRAMLAPADGIRAQANIDNRVVPLVITTARDPAPAVLGGAGARAMRLDVLPEKGSGVRSRPFHAWIVSYRDAARAAGDARMLELARRAKPEGLVPLAVDYGLPLGSVRATLSRFGIVAEPPAAPAAP